MKKELQELISKEYKKNGKKGGTVTKEKYGTDHFSKISRKGVRARKKKSAEMK